MGRGRPIKNILRGFIPERVSNGAVLAVMDLLRGGRQSAAPPSGAVPGAYIEDQCGPCGAIPYGRSSVARAGCGAVAAYNALLRLAGAAPPFERVAAALAQSGLVLVGLWGTSPGGLEAFFRGQGLSTETVRDESRFDSLADRYDAAILLMYNDRHDVGKGLHFVCLTKEGGLWQTHNAGDPSVTASTVTQLTDQLWQGRTKGLWLMGVGGGEIH